RRLIGSLTDGDLRRGFIRGLGFDDSMLASIQNNPGFVRKNSYDQEELEIFKKRNFKIVPILDEQNVIVDILNFRTQSTIISATAVLMAGGEGKRLRPLTENTPKPLLKVGGKPIIEYNVDRLAQVGIKTMYLSVNYLAGQIIDYFQDGADKGISIQYIKEDKPLGTIGSIL